MSKKTENSVTDAGSAMAVAVKSGVTGATISEAAVLSSAIGVFGNPLFILPLMTVSMLTGSFISSIFDD